MSPRQISLVQESWLSVAAIDPLVVGNLFYNRLFELDEQLRPLFTAPISGQSKKLVSMLHYVVSKLDTPDELIDEVKSLAQRHLHNGARPEHYNVLGSALIWALEQSLGDALTEELEEAWIATYKVLAGAMMEATAYQEAA
ncbi:globin family protein [Flaviaesturariibacter terrae]